MLNIKSDMQISRSFKIQEFVPPSIYRTYGENSSWFISKQLVDVLQFIRDHFGKPVTINNWSYGKDFTERGFRLPDSPTGGKLSVHKRGGAADFNIQGLTPQEVNAEILSKERIFMEKGLTTIEHTESTPTWSHVDIRWHNLNKILIVKPAEGMVNINDYAPVQDNYYIYENGEYVAIPFS